jgi:hypothetical protein
LESKILAIITRVYSVIRPTGSDQIFDHPYNADSLERFLGVHDVYFLAGTGRCGLVLWSVSTAFKMERPSLSVLAVIRAVVSGRGYDSVLRDGRAQGGVPIRYDRCQRRPKSDQLVARAAPFSFSCRRQPALPWGVQGGDRSGKSAADGLGGELGSGSDAELGEYVHEVGLDSCP